MSDDAAPHKRALRAELRERRHAMSPLARESAARGIRRQLDLLLERHGARALACYESTPTEPGTTGFVADAVARGIRVLLPVTRADGLLEWTVAGADADTVLGPMAVDDVDLLVIPAAAVDRTGMRLGWGRGYYDKTLGSIRRCPPVYAVVYDSELVDEVPREVHDQPVSGVVTPTRIVDLPARD